MTFFYDLNKRLANLVGTKTELTEGAVAEAGYSAKAARAGKDIGKPGKAFAKIAKSAGEKYGSKERGEKVAGAVLAKLRAKEGVEPTPSKGIPGNVPVPGKMDRLKGKRDYYEEDGMEEGVDKEAFAKLAPPTDKITFADKIAGAKKEVDEMLGDVAAEAMKKAISGHGDEMDEDYGPMEEGYADMDAWLKQREAEKGTGRFDKRKVSTGTVYTRKPETFAGDDEKVDPAGEKRGRGRPKSSAGPRQERVTAKSRKADRTAHGQAGYKKAVKEEETDEGWRGGMLGEPNLVKTRRKGAETAYEEIISFLKSPQSGIEPRARQHLMKLVKELNQQDTPVTEKAVSKKQQKFMGMVHAAQKGEKPASKEVAKVAKEMPKKAAKDFAATKHKGLPEKVKSKKKEEEVEESGTTAGSVATAPAKAGKGGMSFGKGIYDSFNREVEAMISESINVSMNSSTEGGNSLTITATEEDATKLAALLKMAGLGSNEESSSCGCGSTPCSCNDAQEVDENSPDYPTNEVEAEDNLGYSGGLNGPKSTGQTTVPVIASQEERQYADEEEDAIKRMMEMAGIKEAKKPDFLDVDKDGDKKEAFKKAVKDKEEKKVEESIFALTNSWKEYKG